MSEGDTKIGTPVCHRGPETLTKVGLPRVDVIIPTLNSSPKIEQCLSSLRKQDYPGGLNITIVDGGSSDRTLEIARRHAARIISQTGIYSDGLNGAKQTGVRLTDAPLIWFVDSDNYVLEPSVVSDLVRPLLEDPKVSFSCPEVIAGHESDSFNRWLALEELRKFAEIKSRSETKGNWYRVQSMSWGLSNATMIRRVALEEVGGFDVDRRVLRRLRDRGLATAAIVVSAHFYHDQAESFLTYVQKNVKRARRFSSMSENDLKNYLVDYPPVDDSLSRGFMREVVRAPLLGVRQFFRTRDRAWLWGLIFPVLVGLSVLADIPAAIRINRKWLGSRSHASTLNTRDREP